MRKLCVRQNNLMSDYLLCNIGVRQGDNLSPLLFALCINIFQNIQIWVPDSAVILHKRVNKRKVSSFLKLLWAAFQVAMQKQKLGISIVGHGCNMFDHSKSLLRITPKYLASMTSSSTCPVSEQLKSLGSHVRDNRIIFLCCLLVLLSGRSFICLVGTQLFDMSWLGGSYSTFPDRNAVLGHALFGTQFNNMPWLGHRFTTCPARDTVSDMSWSECSFLCPVGTQLFEMSWLGGSYSTFPDLGIALQHALIRTQFYDIPWSGRSFTTCPGWDAIKRYACSGHNLTTCHGWDTALRHSLVGTQFQDMPCSGHSLTTCHGWDTVLQHVVVETQYYMSCGDTVIQHVLVRTQFYDIAWSGRSYTTCPGRGAVLQYAMFWTQFNNILWSGHSFTTCHGWDTVLRALVGTQLFDMSWSGSSYSTFPERGIVL